MSCHLLQRNRNSIAAHFHSCHSHQTVGFCQTAQNSSIIVCFSYLQSYLSACSVQHWPPYTRRAGRGRARGGMGGAGAASARVQYKSVLGRFIRDHIGTPVPLNSLKCKFRSLNWTFLRYWYDFQILDMIWRPNLEVSSTCKIDPSVIIQDIIIRPFLDLEVMSTFAPRLDMCVWWDPHVQDQGQNLDATCKIDPCVRHHY